MLWQRVCTGRSGEFNPIPEGRAAREELIARGIPETVVYEEICSGNTRENLGGALALMQEQDWQRAIIVSHDFHLLRAMREARRLGLDVTGAGVHKTAMVRLPMVLREIAANLVSIVGI